MTENTHKKVTMLLRAQQHIFSDRAALAAIVTSEYAIFHPLLQ